MANIEPLRRNPGEIPAIPRQQRGTVPMQFQELGQQLSLDFTSGPARSKIAAGQQLSQMGFQRMEREMAVRKQTAEKELSLSLEAMELERADKIQKFNGDNEDDVLGFGEYDINEKQDLFKKFGHVPGIEHEIGLGIKISEFNNLAKAKKRRTEMLNDRALASSDKIRDARKRELNTFFYEEEDVAALIENMESMNRGLFESGVYTAQQKVAQDMKDRAEILTTYLNQRKQALYDEQEFNPMVYDEFVDDVVEGRGIWAGLSQDKRYAALDNIDAEKNRKIKEEEKNAEKQHKYNAQWWSDYYTVDHPEKLTWKALTDLVTNGTLDRVKDHDKIFALRKQLTDGIADKSDPTVMRALNDALGFGADFKEELQMSENAAYEIFREGKGQTSYEIIKDAFQKNMHLISFKDRADIQKQLRLLRSDEDKGGSVLKTHKKQAKKDLRSMISRIPQDMWFSADALLKGLGDEENMEEILTTGAALIEDAKTIQEVDTRLNRFIGQYQAASKGAGTEKEQQRMFEELGPAVIDKWADNEEPLTSGERRLLELIRRVHKGITTQTKVWRPKDLKAQTPKEKRVATKSQIDNTIDQSPDGTIAWEPLPELNTSFIFGDIDTYEPPAGSEEEVIPGDVMQTPEGQPEVMVTADEGTEGPSSTAEEGQARVEQKYMRAHKRWENMEPLSESDLRILGLTRKEHNDWLKEKSDPKGPPVQPAGKPAKQLKPLFSVSPEQEKYNSLINKHEGEILVAPGLIKKLRKLEKQNPKPWKKIWQALEQAGINTLRK